MKLHNWLIAIFAFVLPVNLSASDRSSGNNPQIIEANGSFGGFTIGTNIQSGPCLEPIESPPGRFLGHKGNIYKSESSPAVIFADEAGQIQEIAVTGPGIFTQRYVTIGQSTMRDVLRRYGEAAHYDQLLVEHAVALSYANLIFFFDFFPPSVPTDKFDLLSQRVKVITLIKVGSPTSRQRMSFANFLSVVNQPQTHCDVNLWNHVYHSQRLIVNQQCICVTGTIVDATNGRQPDGVRHEADGDAHGWLQVDSEFQNLLNTENVETQGGNLVFEIICRYPVRQADVFVACQGYSDQVTLPPVGSHVRMLGTYVQDTIRNQWMEIHPVTNIKVVP